MNTEFKITPYGNGYKISIGTGKTYRADNLQEVIYAMEHYFNQGIPAYSSKTFSLTEHRKHNEVCHCCPLCR